MSEYIESLEEWLLSQSLEKFPGRGKFDYHSRFRSVKSFLEAEVHPHVEKGPLLQRGEFLTGHGAEHVRTVVRRAGELIGNPDGRLSPYEVYLLLMAAHFHDVGILLGREKHEQNAHIIMTKLRGLFSDDMVELRTIRAIAAAHGGLVQGTRDTITGLPVREHVSNILVRKQFLAAILRFADELADDSERAARIPLALGLIGSDSEIYHQYARHLHSVVVNHQARTISLIFDLTRDVALRTFAKNGSETYLLTEIFNRTVKMHIERMYCMRFMDGVIRVDSIEIQINVFLSPDHPAPVHQIGYRLQETGYPELGEATIWSLCPEIKWTAESLRDELLKHEEGENE